MAGLAKAISVALVIAVVGLVGAGSSATAAVPPTSHHATQAEASWPEHDVGDVWSKARAFAECVVRVGIPSALLYLIATNPAAWGWIVGASQPPWIVATLAAPWLEKIKSVCGHALLP